MLLTIKKNNSQIQKQKKSEVKKMTDKILGIKKNVIISGKQIENNSQPDFSFYKQIYYCTPCRQFFKSTSESECHNMLHLHKLKIPSWPNDVDIINFSFRKNGKQDIACLLCNKYMHSDEKLSKHINTEQHLNHLDLFAHVKTDMSIKNFTKIDVNSSNLKNLKFQAGRDISTAAWCYACDVPVFNNCKSQHANGQRHANSIKNKKKDLTEISKENPSKCFYTCFLCKVSFNTIESLLKHYKSDEHLFSYECFKHIDTCVYTSILHLKNGPSIKCSLCDAKMQNYKTAMDHILGKKHQNKLESSIPYKENQSLPSILLPNKNKSIIKLDDISSQISGMSKIRTETYVSKTIMEKNEFIASKIGSVKLGLSKESLASHSSDEIDSVNNILNDLVNLNLSKLQQSRVSILNKKNKSSTPKTESKLKNFNANVVTFGKSYLKYCIEFGRDNIYNINFDKITSLKQGINSTFLLDSHRVCLPCGKTFHSNLQSLFEHLQQHKHKTNLLQMQKYHKEFEGSACNFSDLRLAELHMQETSEEWIQCYACDLQIKNEDNIILKHTLTKSHINMSKPWKMQSEEIFNQFSDVFKDVWYYAQRFVCKVCKTKSDFEIEFVVHLESKGHKKKVNQLKSKKIELDFNICPACITFWYGESNSYDNHCNDPYHARLATNGDFTIPKMTPAVIDLLNNLDKKIGFLVAESNKAVEENDKELELLKGIEEAAQNVYPRCKAYTFGSRISSLGFPDSDVDVFLDCGNVYYKSAPKEKCQQYLLTTKKFFEEKPNIWIIEECLLATRVPIIKLKHIPTGLKSDISYVNGLSVEKSTLIGHYNNNYPICRMLILFLKKWTTFCQLSGSDGITTFAVSWLVIFYLQIRNILPAVHELIKLENKSKIVDGWECGFAAKFPNSDQNISFKDHLKEFFTYYSGFDYRKNTICPYLGKVIPKRAFAYANQLPEEMQLYKMYLNKHPMDVIFRFDSPMCVQDPIDLSQNITKAVKKLQLRCFKQYCMESIKYCDN